MKIGLAATAGLLLLAGCSSVPDAVNPVEWYKGATSLFEDDEAPATERPTAERPAAERSGESQAYPNLGSVPARPADISSPSERRATQQGLVADRDQARYTDQQPANAIDTGSSSGASRTAPAAAPTPPPAVATPAPTAPAPTAPASATPTTAETTPSAPSAARPPAARIASRAEPTETQSVGAAMLERRRQEVLAERAAAAEAADDSKPPMAPATAPQPSAPQSTAPQSSAPAAMTASRTEPQARTATEIYQEQFARSASPVATRSAEPTQTGGQTGAQTGTQSATAQDNAAPAASDRAGISYLAATILFGHGSTALDPSERETLRKIAAEYRKTGGTLRIVGHASSRTTDMRPLQHQLANFQVSVSRAETVAQELARLGVPARVMQVAGVGDSQPVYYEVMPSGETGNRRVEIFVDY
ncbi:OmpA family protein [Oceanibaculum nanhaiense]|uniref:OmpA family protein n=1 Tax=Oceanibaculum nanhaiense TaxID=1909734 RepID=UPI003F6E985B